jgi:hypothetical protein
MCYNTINNLYLKAMKVLMLCFKASSYLFPYRERMSPAESILKVQYVSNFGTGAVFLK